MASPQVEQGGPIILRGHSDSGGNDEGNMRASRARAEAVRDWLVDSGVDEARISLIAFGEQNPVAPNARPDGSPDPVGRAANRRVEIEVRSENAERSRKRAAKAPNHPNSQLTAARFRWQWRRHPGGYSIVVMLQPSKLARGVRFPLPAPPFKPRKSL